VNYTTATTRGAALRQVPKSTRWPTCDVQ